MLHYTIRCCAVLCYAMVILLLLSFSLRDASLRFMKLRCTRLVSGTGAGSEEHSSVTKNSRVHSRPDLASSCHDYTIPYYTIRARARGVSGLDHTRLDCVQTHAPVLGRNRVNEALYYTYHAVLCYAMLCYAMPCHAMPCHAMPCHAMPCYTVLKSAAGTTQMHLVENLP